MLDPVIELNSYIGPFGEERINVTELLRKKYAKGTSSKEPIGYQMNGIRRPMVVIARYALFGAEGELLSPLESLENDPDAVSKTIQYLKAWCGLEYDCPQADPIKDWLPNYIRYIQEQKHEEPGLNEEWLKQIVSYWDRPVFRNTVKPADDQNGIIFEKIVADAMEEGPLNSYYLACRKDAFDQINKQKQELIIKQAPKSLKSVKCVYPKNNTSPKEMDKILKITAAYLLAPGNRPDRFKDITSRDIQNWCKSFSGDLQDKGVVKYRYKGNDLYEYSVNVYHRTGTGRSIGNKMRLSRQWMEDFDWRLIPQIESIPEGYVAFKDTGKTPPVLIR